MKTTVRKVSVTYFPCRILGCVIKYVNVEILVRLRRDAAQQLADMLLFVPHRYADTDERLIVVHFNSLFAHFEVRSSLIEPYARFLYSGDRSLKPGRTTACEVDPRDRSYSLFGAMAISQEGSIGKICRKFRSEMRETGLSDYQVLPLWGRSVVNHNERLHWQWSDNCYVQPSIKLRQRRFTPLAVVRRGEEPLMIRDQAAAWDSPREAGAR